MIVKILLPVNPTAPASIYTKDRSLVMTVPASDVMRCFRPGEVRGFFKAEVVNDILEIGDREPEQPW